MPFNIHNKVHRYLFARTLGYFFLWGTISIPYLLYRGLDITTATQILALGTIVSMILEYPMGVVADTLGYKNTIVFGTFSCAVAMFLMGQQLPVVGYFLAMGINALGSSSYNGAEEGFLKEISPNFREAFINFKSVITLSGFIASIVAGYLAKVSFLFPIYLYAFLNLMAGIIVLSIPEEKKQVVIKSLLTKVKESLSLVHRNKSLLSLMLFIAFVETYFYNLQIIVGSFGNLYKVNVGVIGIIFGGTFLIRAIGMQATKYLQQISMSLLVLLSNLIFIVTLVLPKNAIVATSVIFVNTFLLSVVSMRLNITLNDIVPDAVRASVISVNRVFMRLFTTLIIIATGYFLKNYNLGYLFFITAICNTAFIFISKLYPPIKR